MEPIPTSPFPADFFTVIAILALVVLAVLKQIDKKGLVPLVRLAFNNSLLAQFSREGRQLKMATSGYFLFIVIVLTAFFQLTYYTFAEVPTISPILVFLAILAFLVCITSLRIVVLTIVVNLYNTEDYVPEYSMNLLVYNLALALVVLPLLICALYGPEHIRGTVLIIGWLCLLSTSLLRLGKIFYTGIKDKGVPVLYNIFYICGLEILPLIIVYTAIKR